MNSTYILPYSYGVKVAYSISYRDRLSEPAKRKLEAYELYKTRKLTMEEIGTSLGVHKSTVSRWTTQVRKALEIRRYQYLEPRSKAPRSTHRKKRLQLEDKEKILDIRREYKCGKDNIHRYLKRDYSIRISGSTIHRYLTNLSQKDDPKWQDKNRKKTIYRSKRAKLVRIKDIVDDLEHRAFERFQVDTKYWVINGRTFYIVAAIDVETRMSFAYAYTRHTSRCATDFLHRLNVVFDIQNMEAYLQRDNGTEFMAEFEEAADEYGIKLITNYVRMPKMNGFVERFNRSMKEELLEYEMPETVVEARNVLYEYVVRYNFKRIHSGTGDITPFERYCEMSFQKPIVDVRENDPRLLHMLWTSTIFCTRPTGMV